jgi:hypothetical protein
MSSGHTVNLEDQMVVAAWPTPTSLSGGSETSNPPGNSRSMNKMLEYAFGPDRGMKAAWPTPTVADVQGGRKHRSGARADEPLLNGLMTWSTPRASDGEKGGPNMSFGAGGQPLPAQMHQSAPRVTPSSRDWKDSAGMATEREDGRSRLDQLPRQMAATDHSGPMPNGSSATTAKRGAPNPVFACWLMGFPDAWISGALRAMQSLSPKRAKSSPR